MNAAASKTGTDYLRDLARQAGVATPRTPTCDIESALRSEVEAWLNSFGVKYVGPEVISLTLIDVKESRGQQARETPIVEDTVQGVLVSLNEGRYVKPIVTFVQGNKASIIDGNNRDEAHRRAGRDGIESYVVDSDTPSATIARMLVDANSHHPQRPDLSWRVKQAAHLMAAYGITREQAIMDANITSTQLSSYLKLVEADKRAGILKIKDFTGENGLPESSRRALHRIPMDTAFHSAARLAIDTGMNSTEVDELQLQVKRFKSEGEMLAFIDKARKERVEAERGRRAGSKLKKDPKNNLSEGVGKVLAVDPVQLAQSCLTDIDRRIVLDRIDEAVSHLARLEAAITMKKVSTGG